MAGRARLQKGPGAGGAMVGPDHRHTPWWGKVGRARRHDLFTDQHCRQHCVMATPAPLFKHRSNGHLASFRAHLAAKRAGIPSVA